jgi:hypothetical protein
MEGADRRKLSVGARHACLSPRDAGAEFVVAHAGDLMSGARLLEVRVRRIVHHELGQPSELLAHVGRSGRNGVVLFDFTSMHGAAS